MTGAQAKSILDGGVVRALLTLLQVVTVAFLGYYASSEKEFRTGIMKAIDDVADDVKALNAKVDEARDEVSKMAVEFAVTQTDVAGLRDRITANEGRIHALEREQVEHIRDGHPASVKETIRQELKAKDAILQMHDRDIKRLDGAVQRLKDGR